ncbi:MAG: precorrin-2 C(20)-methyltransferase [Verrucomicrobiota bacterium]
MKTTKQTTGTLYGVGVGPGNPDLLTVRAVRVFQAVDTIFHVAGPRTRQSISKGIVESLDGCADKSIELTFSMSTDVDERRASVRSAAEQVAERLRQGRDCAFATIGDPFIYSTFSYLLRAVREICPDVAVEVIPGITAFQAAAAAWGKPLAEDEEVLTIVPRWNPDRKHVQALEAADTAVCLKTYRDRAAALQAIEDTMAPEEVLYAARVTQDDEVLEWDADSISQLPIDYLSLTIARRNADA